MSDPLIVDIYAGDLNGKPDLAKLIAAGPPWHGLIIKCTEGMSYSGGAWFQKYWPMARDLAGSRYGVDWFRGCYHYLRILQDPKQQADYYLSAVDKAGGWGKGDIWPMVDVENANNPSNASAQQVIDSVSKFSAEIKAKTGRSVVLYGGSYMSDRQITNHMGCDYLFVARYASTLPADTYQRIGWTLDKLFAWQYCGDGESYLANYPKVTPMGVTDISALTIAGGGSAALEYLRSHLYPAQK